jgi:hypothetical protein
VLSNTFKRPVPREIEICSNYSAELELSEFELTGVNYYEMYHQIQEKLDLVRVSGEFELSEFELARFHCKLQPCILHNFAKFTVLSQAVLIISNLSILTRNALPATS